MKLPIVAVEIAVLGIAIGFIAGKTTADRANSHGDEAPRTISARRAAGTLDSGKAAYALTSVPIGVDISKLTAADVLKLVKANSENRWGDGKLEMMRKHYEFELMLSKLPLPMIEEVLKLSRESGISANNAYPIFSAYAARDLQKAMAWASAQPDAETWKLAAVNASARLYPIQALEMYQQSVLSGSCKDSNAYGMGAGMALGNQYAEQGKAALLQFLDTVPSASVSNLLSFSIEGLPKQDLPGFLDEIEQRVKDGKIDERSVSRLMQRLAAIDPQLAESRIAKMEPGLQKTSLQVSLAETIFEQGKTDEATELMKSAMAQDPGKEKEFIINQTPSIFRSNPDFASRISELLPPGVELTKEDVTVMSRKAGPPDPVTLSQLLKSPEDKAAYLADSIPNLGTWTKLNETDFRVLAHRLDGIGLTGDNAARVQQALTTAREKALTKH
ncbi:MAG: hypothetical protein ABI600_14790 [Luteolibacter sp.]